jgi:hypothetical protein
MNLNLDLSAVPRFFRGIVNEFRDKKLWPVAALLLVGIVAVPILLTSSSNPPAQTETPAPVAPPPSGTTLPALSVQSTPAHSDLTARARDPFASASGSGTSTTGSSTAPNLGSAASVASVANNAVNALNGSSAASSGSSVGSSSSSSGSSASSSGTVSGGGGTSSSSGSSTSSTSSSSSGSTTSPSKPAASGLTSTQSYNVSLSITNGSGGLNAIDSLQRLSVLPGRQQPLLVELGVLRGGNHVLFAVQPGAAVKGPGTCIPGPLDCEVLSLGRNQTELVGRQTAHGVVRVALLAVTTIKVVDHSTAAAAQKARQSASTAGRKLLRNSTLSALSLFQYKNSLGALADLRTLSIG